MSARRARTAILVAACAWALFSPVDSAQAEVIRRQLDSGLTLLAWGARDPNDIVWYPDSKKVVLRGVGIRTRVERLDYWDGEP